MIFVLAGEVIPESQRQGNTGWATVGAVVGLHLHDNKEAEQIVRMWIRQAKKIKDTLESEVVKSAKMYLALKALLRKYNATAIAYRKEIKDLL